MSVEWTDELKQEVVNKYQEQEPTPDNSMDIVNQMAEEYDTTANSVRAILVRQGVYVSKTPSKKSEGGEGSNKGTKMSKEDAQNALASKIEEKGHEADMDIISKLTGKACNYLVSVFE